MGKWRRRSRSRLILKSPKQFSKAMGRFLLKAGPLVLSMGFVGLLGGSAYAYVLNSDLFQLSKVRFEGYSETTGQSDLMGITGLKSRENLLSVDLKKIEKNIRARLPQYHNVKVNRVLPDEIHVSLVRRRPYAQVHTQAYYLIDRERMVLPGVLDTPSPDYPVIEGLKANTGTVSAGKILRDASLRGVIGLLEEIQAIGVLKEHRITSVDVSDRNSLVLWVDGRIEVRMSAAKLSESLKKLEEVLVNVTLDPAQIKYIDLRFDEVVIGPR